MNTEQTEKSLGQWAYEAFPPIPGADVPWRNSLHKDGWEKAAQAVATEVLKRLPGEWVLVTEGVSIEGDEVYACGRWIRALVGRNVKGDQVRRRISPVPSQQPQLVSPEGVHPPVQESLHQGSDVLPEPQTQFWTCETCGRSFRAGEAHFCPGPSTDNPTWASNAMTTPPAPRSEWTPKFKVGDRVRVEGFQTTFTVEYLPHDSKDAYRMVGGYNAKEDELTAAPWKLPEPPENKQWHRVDFTEEMLPEGWRPLLKDEDSQPDDEYLTGNLWRWSGGVSSLEIKARYRTQRPLPAPFTPQPEEIPYEETDLFHARKALLDEGMRANTLMQERDAALARASEAEKQVEYWKAHSESYCKEAGRERARAEESEKMSKELFSMTVERQNEVKELRAENDRLRAMAEEAEQELTVLRERVKDESEQCKTYHDEITRLRASVPVWVPCNRVMPTEKDANAHGRVLFGSLDSIAWSAPWNEVKNATHWMALPPLHVETEEGTDMDRFNRFWDSEDRPRSAGPAVMRAQAYQAFLAALRSKKPS
jgi:hypothetical protein